MADFDKVVEGIKDGGDFDKGARRMRLFRVPGDSRYSRDRVVGIVNANFATLGVSAYPGAVSDQIISWGLDTQLDTVEQFLEEIFTEKDESTYKTSTVAHTELATAIALLSQVCPNLTITPNYEQRALVVFGTPEQHAACKTALEAFDVAARSDAALNVATYTWDDITSYWPVYTELIARFATTAPSSFRRRSITPLLSRRSTQTMKNCKILGDAPQRSMERSRQLRTYFLKNINFLKLAQISPTLLPGVAIYPARY